MRRRVAIVILASIPVWLSTASPPARADSISVKGGGALRGELLTDDRKLAQATEITIRTLSGATVTVARDEVDSIVRRSLVAEEYDVRRRTAPDTVTGQWTLAVWCDQNALIDERDVHLRRVIDFDRNHLRARRMLGHHNQGGRWRKPGEYMNFPGFVAVKAKFSLPLDWDSLQTGDLNAEEKGWARRVRTIHDRLMSGRRETSREALKNLRSIQDPDAIPALERYLQEQPDRSARLIVLEILSLIPGERSLGVLVSRSIRDAAADLREAALGAVLERGADRATDHYVAALRDPQVIIVNRAGYALGILGNENAVPQLADALMTSDEYEEWTLAPDGLIKERRRGDRENPEVLRALVLLSGENLGYDKAAWRRWYAARRMLSDRNQPDDLQSLPNKPSRPASVRTGTPSDSPEPRSTTRATRGRR